MRPLVVAVIPAAILTGMFVALVALGMRGAGQPFGVVHYLAADWEFVTGLFVVTYLVSLCTFWED